MLIIGGDANVCTMETLRAIDASDFGLSGAGIYNVTTGNSFTPSNINEKQQGEHRVLMNGVRKYQENLASNPDALITIEKIIDISRALHIASMTHNPGQEKRQYNTVLTIDKRQAQMQTLEEKIKSGVDENYQSLASV